MAGVEGVIAGVTAANNTRGAEQSGGPSYLAREVFSLDGAINPVGARMGEQLARARRHLRTQDAVARMQQPRSGR